MLIKNKKENICILIGVAIPARRNVVQKEAGKEIKYKSLCIEVHEMYDYTGNNWSQRNSNERYKENFVSHTRKQSVDSLQKTAVLGTSHIIRKVRMQCET